LVEMPAVQTLAPGGAVSGRPFADPANTLHDLAALSAMHWALRLRVHLHPSGGRWSDAGAEHWLVVLDPVPLAALRPVVGVGFFGRLARRSTTSRSCAWRTTGSPWRRPSPGCSPTTTCASRTPSGETWSSSRGDGDPAHVRADPIHGEAIARTALHYRSLRLHRLRFSGGGLDDPALDLVSTLLIDFAQIPPWRAIRASRS
jgi:hypothetical protein